MTKEKSYFEHVNQQNLKRHADGIEVEEYVSDTSRVKFMAEFQKALEELYPIDEKTLTKELEKSRKNDA